MLYVLILGSKNGLLLNFQMSRDYILCCFQVYVANGKLQLAMPMDRVKEMSKLSLMVSMVFLFRSITFLNPKGKKNKLTKLKQLINECVLNGFVIEIEFTENS